MGGRVIIKAIVVKLVLDGSLVATPASCRVKTLPLLQV